MGQRSPSRDQSRFGPPFVPVLQSLACQGLQVQRPTSKGEEGEQVSGQGSSSQLAPIGGTTLPEVWVVESFQPGLQRYQSNVWQSVKGQIKYFRNKMEVL